MGWFNKIFCEVCNDLLCDNVSRPIQTYSLFSPKIEQFQLRGDRKLFYSKEENETIIDLFEQQAKQTPNRLALIFKQTQITYHQLSRYTNYLSDYLNKQGVKTGSFVAVCLDRSEYIPVVLLGILKSGAAYIPISPQYPFQRISYILNDTKAKTILFGGEYPQELIPFARKWR